MIDFDKSQLFVRQGSVVKVSPSVSLSKARGKLSVALDLILQTGLPQIDCCLRKQLVSQGYITKFSAAGDMSFVRCMPPQQAITHLLAKVRQTMETKSQKSLHKLVDLVSRACVL